MRTLVDDKDRRIKFLEEKLKKIEEKEKNQKKEEKKFNNHENLIKKMTLEDYDFELAKKLEEEESNY